MSAQRSLKQNGFGLVERGGSVGKAGRNESVNGSGRGHGGDWTECFGFEVVGKDTASKDELEHKDDDQYAELPH